MRGVAVAESPVAISRRERDERASPPEVLAEIATFRDLATPVALTAGLGIAATLAIWSVAAEARFQLPPHWAAAATMAGLGCGAGLGLWLPRRYIVRQLVTLGADHLQPAGWREGRSNSSLASGICGGLFLLLAIVSLVVHFAVGGMEAVRASIVAAFLLPISIIWLLLGGLIALLAAAAACVSVTLLAVLHGWLRSLAQPHAPIAALWQALFVGAIAPFTVIAFDAAPQPALVASGLAFALAAATVSSRARLVSPTSRGAASRSLRPSRSAARRRMGILAMSCACAGALVAASSSAEVQSPGQLGLVAGASLLAAFLSRRVLLALPVRVGVVAWSTLLLFSMSSFGFAPMLGLIAAIIATVWIAVGLARHLISITGSVQAALSRIGEAASVGLSVGALLGAVVTQLAIRHSQPLPAAMISADNPIQVIVRDLRAISAPDLLNPHAPITIWNLERAVLVNELLIQYADRLGIRTSRRFFSRIASALASGGRLIVEVASEEQAQHAARIARRERQIEAAWLLEIPVTDGPDWRAIILGRDVPAWLAHLTGPESSLQLRRLDSEAPIADVLVP